MTSEDLTVHWPYLVLAVALLWFPRQWLRAGPRVGRRRRRHQGKLEQFAENKARDPDDKSVRLGVELTNKRNYLDLLRAAAGAYCLAHSSFVLTAQEAAARHAVLGLELFVCLVGLLVQCVRREEKVSFFAPIFYLVGFSLGFADRPYPAAFALLLVMAINPVIPNPRVFLAAFGLLMLPFGVLFSASLPKLAGVVVLVTLPSLLSLLAGRPLVIYSKRVKPA